MASLVVAGRNAAKWVRRLHAEDEGMETIQIIMILAIAAMVLTGVNGLVGINASGKQDGGMFGSITSAIGNLFGGGLSGLGSGLVSGIGGLFGL